MIRNLRMFITYEEWGAQPPKEMYRNSSSLTEDELRIVDNFLKPQMRRKNELMHNAGIGYHVMDRAPLDLIAFSNRDSENKKKIVMLETFVAGDRGFRDGVAILLTADPKDLERSQWTRGISPQRFGGEGFTIETLNRQQELLKAIYIPCRTVPRRFNRNATETARDVAFGILTGKYEVVPLWDRVQKVKAGEIAELYQLETDESGARTTKGARRKKSRERG